MIFLVPFDSTTLPLGLPVDATLDRVALIGMGALWVCAIATSGQAGPRMKRLGTVGVALVALLIVSTISELLNYRMLLNLGEDGTAFKRLASLFAVVLFLWLVVTVVRPSEVRAFARLLVALGSICAIGVIYQFRTDTNVFFSWTQKLFGSIAHVGVAPTPQHAYDRLTISGPTQHALAVATMLSLVLPIAIAGMWQVRSSRNKWLGMVLTGLLLMGTLATVKRTAMILPACAVAALLCYRPRAMLKLVPVALPIIVALPLIVPNAAGSTVSAFTGKNSLVEASTEGRRSDYIAVAPDVVAKPAFGRGLGSYDPRKYRFLDNQYLSFLIETGAIGVLTYLAVILASAAEAHRAQRSRAPSGAMMGVAAFASTAVFAVASFLFDAFSFLQPAYVFMFIVGLLLVSRQPLRRNAPTSAHNG